MDSGSHVGFQISTKKKSGRGPSNEHFWQVWFNSVQWFQRRFKREKKKANGRTLTHDKSSHGLWPGELKIPIFDKSSSMILILLKLINLKIINSIHNSSIYVQVTQDA
jgi:hypothetical protein